MSQTSSAQTKALAQTTVLVAQPVEVLDVARYQTRYVAATSTAVPQVTPVTLHTANWKWVRSLPANDRFLN